MSLSHHSNVVAVAVAAVPVGVDVVDAGQGMPGASW
jgi:phosphopantetheinyl transferase